MSAPKSFCSPVSMSSPSTRTMMRSASTESTMPPRWHRTTAPESWATTCLEAGADERRLGAQQRHRLALHVGAHQRAVGVVVLEERDQRRGHRHQLLRRDVHVVDAVALDGDELAAGAGDHPVVD